MNNEQEFKQVTQDYAKSMTQMEGFAEALRSIGWTPPRESDNPKGPFLASIQNGMHFILSQDDEIILRADWMSYEELKQVADAMNASPLPKEPQPEQWEPEIIMDSITCRDVKGTDLIDTVVIRTNDKSPIFRTLNFYFNVYQLIQDLNGDWKRGDGIQDCGWLYWNFDEGYWGLSLCVRTQTGTIGPFKDTQTTQEARKIMSAQPWSKNGPPII